MRLGIQLLDTSSTVNSMRKITEQSLRQGETVDVCFQLVDLDQASFRYIPGSSSTVFVEIPRFPEAFSTNANQRDIKDFSVRRYVVPLFVDDRSTWKLSLSAVETSTLATGGMRVTITDGSNIKIAYLTLAFRVYRGED